ncbi:AP-4 complex accessory subunit tepsin isoform X2 [Lissotriton helveticus]
MSFSDWKVSRHSAMAVLDRLSFLQKLPVLIRATSDDEIPCPGYVFEEIAKISHESVTSHQCLLEYLLNRLQSQSCYIKLKVLKILLYLCAHGSTQFLQDLRRNSTFIQEATVFSGPPDPLHGNSLYQKVRCTAQDLASKLFNDALAIPRSLLPPRPLSQTGMGSKCEAGGTLQGFGYNQECVGSGELIMNTIQKVAGVVSNAVLSCPDLSRTGRPDDDAYQPVTAPPPGMSGTTDHALPTIPTRSRASRQPGLAGGGWEESDSGHSSQQSSQENYESGQTSVSGSDSHSGASREAGDLTERAECVQLSDCMQEISLVDTVTQGTKVFLTKEEVQHFLKECSLLNCEAVLELLTRKLQNPSTSIQMRSMSGISSLMCSDLLSHEHMFSVTRTLLQQLSEGSPGPVANRATKMLRQFEALSRSKAPANNLCLEHVSPLQHGTDLLADSTPFPKTETVLSPFGMSRISSGSSEQFRMPQCTPFPSQVLSYIGDRCTEEEIGHGPFEGTKTKQPNPAYLRPPTDTELQSSPVQAEEPANQGMMCSKVQPKGDVESETMSMSSVSSAPASQPSLFAGMDIILSSSTIFHDTMSTCNATETTSTTPTPVQTATDPPNNSIFEPKGPSAFSFLNI